MKKIWGHDYDDDEELYPLAIQTYYMLHEFYRLYS